MSAPVSDLLAELAARHPRGSWDCTEMPACVTVQTEAGARHYFGGSLSSALAQALAATTPRAEREGEE